MTTRGSAINFPDVREPARLPPSVALADHHATHRLPLLQSFQAEVAPLGTVRERGELHVAELLSAGVTAWLAQFRHIPVAAGAEVVGPDDLLLSGYPVGDHQARNLVLDAQALATVGG